MVFALSDTPVPNLFIHKNSAIVKNCSFIEKLRQRNPLCRWFLLQLNTYYVSKYCLLFYLTFLFSGWVLLLYPFYTWGSRHSSFLKDPSRKRHWVSNLFSWNSNLLGLSLTTFQNARVLKHLHQTLSGGCQRVEKYSASLDNTWGKSYNWADIISKSQYFINMERCLSVNFYPELSRRKKW